MPDRTMYGLIGNKIAPGTGSPGRGVDVSAQFALGEKVLFQEDATGNVYVAVYVYAGQTISGSANCQLGSVTASVTISNTSYIAMLSVSVAANTGEFIWIRSSAAIV